MKIARDPGIRAQLTAPEAGKEAAVKEVIAAAAGVVTAVEAAKELSIQLQIEIFIGN